MNNLWKPRVTVAGIVEADGRFLMVEEQVPAGLVLNQPAGHLEANETLIDAVVRETLEESGWHITPVALIGVYQWQHPSRDMTVIRFAIAANAVSHEQDLDLDEGIVGTLWLTPDDIRNQRDRLRSPMVLQGIEDSLAGCRYPLEILNNLNIVPKTAQSRQPVI